MSKNIVPDSKKGLNKLKMETAREIGVNLSDGYNGNLTSRENGSVGGEMVRKIVDQYEKGIK